MSGGGALGQGGKEAVPGWGSTPHRAHQLQKEGPIRIRIKRTNYIYYLPSLTTVSPTPTRAAERIGRGQAFRCICIQEKKKFRHDQDWGNRGPGALLLQRSPPIPRRHDCRASAHHQITKSHTPSHTSLSSGLGAGQTHKQIWTLIP
jgi:hypothetical protein